MGADQHIDWNANALSVLDWWREAGVDVLVDDVPRDWLARTPPSAPLLQTTATASTAPTLPDTLEAFVAWRTGADAPEGDGGAGVLVEGDPAAPLMVVVDCPDGDCLIDGAAGRLFDRMLAAIGHSRDSIYLVALTHARPLGGRIAPESLPRLGELLRHHVALVQPPRVLLLGQAPSRALSETNETASDRSLRVINLDGAKVPAVSSLHPRFLIERPAMKAQAWKDLQMLLGDMR